uniref:HECT domain-containing protein n=2 Tax=Clytia hemisphaerica TaxID=252671 RepID=A0A7M5VC91_9CNID
MGIRARGDLLALRAFCLPKMVEDNEEKLYQEVKRGQGSTKKTKSKRERSISIGWIHYDRKAGRYAGVRSKRGGGLRSAKMHDSSTRQDILGEAEKIFFPKGKSQVGQLALMITLLGKFDETPLPSTIEVDGKEVQFSLGGYLQENRLTKAKFYLMTKSLSFLDKVNELSSDDDFDLPPAPMNNSLSPKETDENTVPLQTLQQNNQDSLLIGSTQSRTQLQNEIEKAFKESEYADKRKAEVKKHQAEENERLAEEKKRQADENERLAEEKKRQAETRKQEQENLRQSRLSRVKAEPNLSEDHTVISVRHPKLGTRRRVFLDKDNFSCVYDWVGSLDIVPKYFQLIHPSGQLLQPWKTVSAFGKVVLNMEACDNALELEPEGEVALSGFSVQEDLFAYADEEIADINQRLPVNDIEEETIDCQCDIVEYLKKQQTTEHGDVNATLVAHRRPKSFWNVFFKQNVDLKRPFRVIWAGETSSDDGGPFREFLLRCMEQFQLLNSYFFGEKYKLLFTALTDAVIKKHYFVLGQLSALSILHIGRGPQCLHPGIVDRILRSPNPVLLDDIQNGEYEANVTSIKNGETDSLLDAGIMPSKDRSKDLQDYCEYFCVISKAAAIEQFREGFRSIDGELLKKNCCLRKFFISEEIVVGLDSVRQVLQYHCGLEGSNIYEAKQDSIVEFELFLVKLASGGCKGLSLKDFLVFAMALDRIPVFGLPKMFEVYFEEGKKMPITSTCGLFITIFMDNMSYNLEYAIRECVGYGLV